MNYKTILKMLIDAVPDSLLPDLKEAADKLLDKVEVKMADNALVMAICAKLRSGMNIPDND
jgi:hypothetical protein